MSLPKEMDLHYALQYAADAIREKDGGDMTTKTGWRSEELLTAWLAILGELERRNNESAR